MAGDVLLPAPTARHACVGMHKQMPHRTNSPRAVPVPCICRPLMSDGASPASVSAARSTCCCAGPLGAVRLLLRPSWLTAEPAYTHQHTLSEAKLHRQLHAAHSQSTVIARHMHATPTQGRARVPKRGQNLGGWPCPLFIAKCAPMMNTASNLSIVVNCLVS
jgi:hypothetical protein